MHTSGYLSDSSLSFSLLNIYLCILYPYTPHGTDNDDSDYYLNGLSEKNFKQAKKSI